MSKTLSRAHIKITHALFIIINPYRRYVLPRKSPVMLADEEKGPVCVNKDKDAITSHVTRPKSSNGATATVRA
jgi:hypothetical protein